MNLFLAALLVGLATSFHCVAMCGSLVLTYAVKDETKGTWLARMLPHAVYQGAKILSYVVVGLLLGSIGLLLGLDASLGGLRGYFTIVAASLMVLLGVQMTGKFPQLNKFVPRPPKFLVQALTRTRAKARDGKPSLATPVTFGLLTGLMPCAPLMAQQAAAAASGSPVSGALIMLGFGLGTAPLMLGFGAVAGALSQNAKRAMNLVAAVVIVVFGLVMLNRGLMLVGSPVTAQKVVASLGGSAAPAADIAFTEAADGVAEVPLVIENTQFVPQTVAVPSDRPVRLIVERREGNACSDQIAVPQLGILQNLTPNGTTVVELPAAKSGSYTLTCGMGMMSGTLSVGAGAPGSGGLGTGALVLLLGAAAAGVAALAVRAGGKQRVTQPVAGTSPVHAMTPKRRVRYLEVVVLAGLALFGAAAYAVSQTRVADAQNSLVAAAGEAGVPGAAGGAACACCGTGGNPTGEPIVGSATVEGDVQRISVDVSQGYYDPDTIKLKAGVPAEITFSQSSGCTGQVMSKDLGFFEDLTSGPKTVKLPALQPGEYGFSCGMEMVFGTIVVE